MQGQLALNTRGVRLVCLASRIGGVGSHLRIRWGVLFSVVLGIELMTFTLCYVPSLLNFAAGIQ